MAVTWATIDCFTGGRITGNHRLLTLHLAVTMVTIDCLLLFSGGRNICNHRLLVLQVAMLRVTLNCLLYRWP